MSAFAWYAEPKPPSSGTVGLTPSGITGTSSISVTGGVHQTVFTQVLTVAKLQIGGMIMLAPEIPVVGGSTVTASINIPTRTVAPSGIQSTTVIQVLFGASDQPQILPSEIDSTSTVSVTLRAFTVLQTDLTFDPVTDDDLIFTGIEA